jgi:hypothetical protein
MVKASHQDLLDLAAHSVAQLHVEPAQRLIEEEAARVPDDGPAHGDPLLLPLGQLGRQGPQVGQQVELCGDLPHPALDLGLRQGLGVQGKRQVLGDREAGVEGIELEHHGDVPLRGGQRVDPLLGDQNLTGSCPLQPGDHPERGGLAAARRAQQAEHLAGLHVQIDVVDGDQIAELLGQIA